uniref:Transformer-2 protein homolog alpha (Trinotate prediction) n=1 Tax=Myxobolus squamalis TaxID=59785 RepID=A0A6B2G7Y7_MYXSQ
MSDIEVAQPRDLRNSKEARTPSRSPVERRGRNRSEEKKSRKRSRTPSRSRSRSRRSVSRGSPKSSRERFNGARVENPKPCKCLGVFGLSLYTKERDLKDMFRKCGSIEECTIVYDRRTGRSRGFGFVRFKYQEDADEVCADRE